LPPICFMFDLETRHETFKSYAPARPLIIAALPIIFIQSSF
jgi:hypothetical protein